MKGQWVVLMQRRVAQLAIGPSTLRNQGNRGVAARARDYLEKMDLGRFTVKTELQFRRLLDHHTKKLQRSLPIRARHWGTARKALNIFLRDALYCGYLREHFHLAHLEPWLEIPLDKQVARGIRAADVADGLPGWTTIKSLTPSQSESFQEAARLVAEAEKISRVHLDLQWWRPPA